jgi:hypothetical protein
LPLREEKARRLTTALLANVENWEQRVLAVAECCPVGCKHEALSLARDIEIARGSLERLIRNLDEG